MVIGAGAGVASVAAGWAAPGVGAGEGTAAGVEEVVGALVAGALVLAVDVEAVGTGAALGCMKNE